jgi:hypothetical protein
MAARRPIALLAPALALLLSPTPPVWAQTIRGIIVDDVSGRPIEEAVVDLVDAEDRILGQDVTDINGWFSIPVPDGETYQLRSGGLGYLPTLSTEFSLEAGQTLGAELRMGVSPVRIEGIEAVVEGGIEMGLDRVGFYDRQQIGFGQVRTPEDLEKNPPLDLSDLFRGINGIKLIQRTPFADMEILSARRVFGDPCRPSISVDRVIIQRGRRLARLSASARELERAVGGGRETRRSFWQDLVSVHEIAAIEVYAGQGGLPHWVAGDVSPCGAVLFWTKGYVATR